MSKKKRCCQKCGCDDCCCKVERCAVSADGHCGCIEVERGKLQIVYLQSLAVTLPTMFGGRQYVTVTNEGPGAMRVWIDTMPSNSIQLLNGLAGPPVAGSQPDLAPSAADAAFELAPGQSATVAVATVVIVGAVDRHAEGCYVISWCCPEGLDLHIHGDGDCGKHGYGKYRPQPEPEPKQGQS